MKRQLATALALTLATAFANPASATAMYFADVFAEVIITDITGPSPGSDILVDGDAFSSGLFEDSFGTGIVDPASVTTDFFGDGFALSNTVSGSAAPPLGGAVSDSLTDAFLILENISTTDTYSIELFIAGGATVSASVMDPFVEDALAAAIVEVDIDLAPVLTIELLADGLFGPPDDGDIGDEPVTVVLAPGDFVEITAIADVFGFAEAFPVPEPGTLMLASLGLLGLARVRRCA